MDIVSRSSSPRNLIRMQSDLWYRAMPGTIVTLVSAGGLAAGFSSAGPAALAVGSAFAGALAALAGSSESAAGLEVAAGVLAATAALARPAGAAAGLADSVLFAASAALAAAGLLASARSAGLAGALVAWAATWVFSLVDGPRSGTASGGVPAAERAGADGASAAEAPAAGWLTGLVRSDRFESPVVGAAG